MTGAEILARATITGVWDALGGPRPKGRRYQAFYRNGDGLNVTLSDEKNTWFDFVTGIGGGILDLIVIVRDCSRQDALCWLAADYLHVELDGAGVAAANPDFRIRRRVAETRALELASWRAALLQSLKQRRNAAWDSERAASSWARESLNNTAMDTNWRWEAAWAHAQDDLRGDEIAAEIERIEKMDPTELLSMRAKLEAAWVAA